MIDTLKTVSIPSVALAMMALRLAEYRAAEAQHDRGWVGFHSDNYGMPSGRAECQLNPSAYPVSSRYYEIIDAIAQGKTP